ncbi:AraC-like DNA-binding protein [Clostridium saccharoperbutylacetonicum]|uniref:Transcriptional regulator AraC family n=1 Tax=Clostridium saccharoperbutylacetonicum N1-4(HMT) TaxID=931276 RepID=M1MGS4_9CLOT|nr:AraC family transcriptional regulator [Clostridium saccharoperbutylacetonicum]AGF55543.1 transcriptional regulator AraC family [Clostridium saccharoperbutylacetonicum N1-4(HMT)]NRT63738.1 AraC-like DNA-binding protein [Clostridium saccharoperbutylacetonicum]NSB27101.1 AraC-like DNA-binding protein [Clostridium saccharoperbutylacetonicum]NSB40586.1 AraC-like DNA-binding protein [Clostridium saccharoperbutylacetonicum]
MNLNDLTQYLYTYNEDEIFYRKYYEARQDIVLHKGLLENIDKDYIIKHKLIIPEVSDKEIPKQMADETYFEMNSQNSIILLKHNRYTPEFTHKHVFFELIYVLAGQCTQKIGEHHIEMGEGDITIVSPNVKHSIAVFDDSIIINLLIRRNTFEDIFFDFLRNNNLLSNFFINNLYKEQRNDYIIFRTSKDEEIRNSILEMFLEYKNRSRYYNNILNNLLMVFFARLLRSHEKNVELPSLLKKETLRHIEMITYIQDNYIGITLDDVARRFHFSSPHSSKLIKEATGLTFTQLIQKIRLERAENLLLNTNISIADISNSVGYPTVEHFIRLFKRKNDISPSQYRKNNKLN